MKKDFTNDIEFVNEFDPLAAKVYIDKKSWCTYAEIARYRGITSKQAKELYLKAKNLLRNKDDAWILSLDNLSNGSKKALIKSRYRDFASLYDDIMKGNENLENTQGLGHKKATEIRRFFINYKKVID